MNKLCIASAESAFNFSLRHLHFKHLSGVNWVRRLKFKALVKDTWAENMGPVGCEQSDRKQLVTSRDIGFCSPHPLFKLDCYSLRNNYISLTNAYFYIYVCIVDKTLISSLYSKTVLYHVWSLYHTHRKKYITLISFDVLILFPLMVVIFKINFAVNCWWFDLPPPRASQCISYSKGNTAAFEKCLYTNLLLNHPFCTFQLTCNGSF